MAISKIAAIRNQTNGSILAEKYQLCTTMLQKAMGLMFSRPKNLVFRFEKEKTVPLHMFFVFYPIDVIFLDKNRQIVEIKKEFRPFSVYTPRQKAQYVIELPNGKISETKTKINDCLDF